MDSGRWSNHHNPSCRRKTAPSSSSCKWHKKARRTLAVVIILHFWTVSTSQMEGRWNDLNSPRKQKTWEQSLKTWLHTLPVQFKPSVPKPQRLFKDLVKLSERESSLWSVVGSLIGGPSRDSDAGWGPFLCMEYVLACFGSSITANELNLQSQCSP